MKLKKTDIHRHYSTVPRLQSEKGRQSLTSFSGLVVFQKLFQSMNLDKKIKDCFSHREESKNIFPTWWVSKFLIIHLLLGYRFLRDIDFYSDDPMVKRILGVTALPDASTLSRRLKEVDSKSTDNIRGFNREMVFNRVASAC